MRRQTVLSADPEVFSNLYVRNKGSAFPPSLSTRNTASPPSSEIVQVS